MPSNLASKVLSFTPLASADDHQQIQAIPYSVPILTADAFDNIRLVIVCVKAYQVLDALSPYSSNCLANVIFCYYTMAWDLI